MAEPILLTLLFLVNDPIRRSFVRPSLDLQVLLSPFTNTDVPPGGERSSRLEIARSMVVTMMRTWPGLFILTSDPYVNQSILV
jgi:rapamycin-insensitive companion of mTOR